MAVLLKFKRDREQDEIETITKELCEMTGKTLEDFEAEMIRNGLAYLERMTRVESEGLANASGFRIS